eukprot:scaffold69130_cov14-Tisochrysis_lutea.AAC.1
MSEDRCLYACMCTVIDDHQHIHTHNLPESKAAIETDKMATIYRHGTLAFHLAAGRFWSAALSAYKGCPNAPPLKMGKMGSLIAWPKPGSFNCETKNTAGKASYVPAYLNRQCLCSKAALSVWLKSGSTKSFG